MKFVSIACKYAKIKNIRVAYYSQRRVNTKSTYLKGFYLTFADALA